MVFRVIYLSRNRLTGPPERQVIEIEQILDASNRNNAASGLTGALLFNRCCFAQVLEGPRDEVEKTFERIASDQRHSDVTVLHAGAVPRRDFPAWSMRYAGRIEDDRVNFASLTAAPEESAMTVLGLLQELCQREESIA